MDEFFFKKKKNRIFVYGAAYARNYIRHWVGRKTSKLNTHVQEQSYIHKPQASFFAIIIVKHALKKKRKAQSKSSHFLTPSNHISRKCLLTEVPFSEFLLCVAKYAYVLYCSVIVWHKWANSTQKVLQLFFTWLCRPFHIYLYIYKYRLIYTSM